MKFITSQYLVDSEVYREGEQEHDQPGRVQCIKCQWQSAKYTLAPAAVCRDQGTAGDLAYGPGTGPPVQGNYRYK